MSFCYIHHVRDYQVSGSLLFLPPAKTVDVLFSLGFHELSLHFPAVLISFGESFLSKLILYYPHGQLQLGMHFTGF